MATAAYVASESTGSPRSRELPEANSKTGRQGAEQNQRVDLPECLQQLDLDDQQKQQLLAIYRESDLKSQELWDRVQDLHRQAISMEAAVIAAERMEGHDHNSHANQPGQRSNSDQEFRANRAEPRKAPGQIDDNDPARKTDAASSPRENAENRKAARSQERDEAAAGRANRREERSQQDSTEGGDHQSTGWQALDGNLNIVVIRVGVAQPDGKIREYLLTQPNQNPGGNENQTFYTHQSQLAEVWKEIHEGHEQLVELEASTIVKVEAQLTEAQLKKLDTLQSQASTNPQGQDDDARR